MLSGVGGGVKGRDRPRLLFVKELEGCAVNRVNSTVSTSGPLPPWAYATYTLQDSSNAVGGENRGVNM